MFNNVMLPLSAWYFRMPQQCIARNVHDIMPDDETNAIIDAIWFLELEGDIYTDGEVYADVDALAAWRQRHYGATGAAIGHDPES
jgi:hypothetical protein